MSQGSPDSNRHAISVALFGMLVLTLGMGIGRFLYTPMLPVLLSEGQFTFDQLSWIASANYAGYLAGSLLFSFGLFHLPSRLRPMLLTSALATAGLILAMASLTQPALVMLIRFLAGVASAGMMIFGSMIVLHHTRHPFVIAALFSGVGAGILLGNEYVISGLHFALSSHTLWLGAAAASALFFVLLVILLPSRDHVLPAAAPVKTEHQPMSWWLLALLYGLAGFGYIIVATYLPLMAKSAGSPLLTAHLWSLVGISIIPGCFAWLWAARRWGVLQCLTANLLIQSTCVLMTLASGSLPLLVISSMGFGATFMGTTSLVMPLARQLSVPRNINLLGLVTLTYGIGQILGPLLTSLLGSGALAIVNATVCGAVALFIAALISLTQLYKQRFASPKRV
ncbi:TPA: MFS transporter [Citrobacter freundii]|uniref:MFS transporter n=1 Tax=Citrobacter freundii TaxID=546 RepID=A0AAI9HEP2_CITFR|nr:MULTISPECIES: MFS transporter [Citrobacter]EKV7198641.1 MFS transporter [Citrobacter freundii]EKW4401733.1 MFS transporter [Citrobacter freundii]EKX8775675.1 MFS transporter [Citrobacter freundii]ELF4150159.1 MFS transporter [Citrobacter freundii]ELI8780194.1 MFS transporter [Citrobacter freundii]